MQPFSSLKNYPGLLHIALLSGIYLLCAVAEVQLLPQVRIFDNPDYQKMFQYVAGYAFAVGTTLGVAIFLKKRSGEQPVFHLGNIPLPIYPLLFMVILPGNASLSPIYRLLPVPEDLSGIMEDMTRYPEMALLLTTLMAPLMEELLFRGIILEGLLRRYSPWVAIVMSSVIFGAAHLNLAQFVVAFFLGLLFGWIYWRTGSLLACLFGHFVHNLMVLLGAWYANPAKQPESTVPNESYWMTYLICVLITVWMISLIHTTCKQAAAREDEEEM